MGTSVLLGLNGRMVVMRMSNKAMLTIPRNSASRYVLAYGSNLSLERMKRRCPSCKVVGTAELPGYRLLFKKSMTGAYATIEQDANWTVPVVVYRISAADELRLDRVEGCPAYYYKHEFILSVKRTNGRKTRELCSAYIMHEYRALGKPCMEYFRLLDAGYAQYGFDLRVLDEGLAASIGRKAAEDYIASFIAESQDDPDDQ